MSTVKATCPACSYEYALKIDESQVANLDSSSNNERHYKLNDLEKLLGVSRRTLKRWIYTGKLAAVKLGSEDGGTPWYVSESALTAFRQKNDR